MTYSYFFINEPFQFDKLSKVLGLDSQINTSLHKSRGIEHLFSELFYEIQEKRKLGELDFQDSLKVTKLIVLSLKDSPELGKIFEDLETTGMNLEDLRAAPDL